MKCLNLLSFWVFGLMFILFTSMSAANAAGFQAVVSQDLSKTKQNLDQATPQQIGGYILGPFDVIHVEALNHADFNVKATIGSDGFIQLPYLGSIQAANMTSSELRTRIANELRKSGIYSDIVLELEVLSYASRYVTVLGGVATPGLIALDRGYHLSEILARAGGIRDGGSNYVILRPRGGEERNITIRELATGSDGDDPLISPGDKIYVPTDVFYIKGEIKAAGSYPVALGMTLAMAVARGGGLTDYGSSNRITVTRGSVQIRPDDLNFTVLPNDVIDVGQNWF